MLKVCRGGEVSILDPDRGMEDGELGDEPLCFTHVSI